VRIAETTKGQLLDEKGQPRSCLLSQVQPVVSNAITDLEVGGVSDPIKTDEGYIILVRDCSALGHSRPLEPASLATTHAASRATRATMLSSNESATRVAAASGRPTSEPCPVEPGRGH